MIELAVGRNPSPPFAQNIHLISVFFLFKLRSFYEAIKYSCSFGSLLVE